MHLSDYEERMPSTKKFRFYPEGMVNIEDFTPVGGGGRLSNIYRIEGFRALRTESPYLSRLLVGKA